MHTRYLILLIIFIVPPLTTPIVQRCLLLVPKWQRVAVKCGFDGLHLLCFWLGLLLMQIPGGWLLDKFGSKKVSLTASFSGRCSPSCKALSICSAGLGWDLHVLYAIYAGVLGAPSFPANARIVAAWFPTKELVLPPPSLTRRNISRWRSFRAAWLADFRLGLGARLYRYGGIGFVLTALWIKLIHNPTDHHVCLRKS